MSVLFSRFPSDGDRRVERTGQLVQKPVRRRAEALLVLPKSTNTHFDCSVRLVVESCRSPDKSEDCAVDEFRFSLSEDLAR